MGVHENLGGIVFTPAAVKRAQALGIDLPGIIAGLQNSCGAMSQKMNSVVRNVLTPVSGEAVNATTINSLINAVGGIPPLLSDNFSGSGPLIGRQPNVGGLWNATGAASSNLVVGGNTLTQTASGSSYSTNALSSQPGEIGCTFRLSSVANKMNVGGTPANGSLLIVNIYPSGNANFYQVTYTLTGTDTLATAATAFASAITSNSTSASNGITATASGTTVSVTATNCPRLVTATTGALTMSSANSPAPTIASYQTGQNFLNGMVHFRLGVEGLPDWTFYNNGQVAFSSLTRTAALKGLAANTDYIYRCCLAPPYVWGGLWSGSTLLNAAWAQDANMATYAGASCFFENGLDPSVLSYESVWAYPQPSVSLPTIQSSVP